MARSDVFNPRGTFVASKANGMILASRHYQLGETIDKTGISRRKLMQLWEQGRIAYEWMVDKSKRPLTAKEIDAKADKQSKTSAAKVETKLSNKSAEETKVKSAEETKVKSKSKETKSKSGGKK